MLPVFLVRGDFDFGADLQQPPRVDWKPAFFSPPCSAPLARAFPYRDSDRPSALGIDSVPDDSISLFSTRTLDHLHIWCLQPASAQG